MTNFNANLATVTSAYANKIFVNKSMFTGSYKRSINGNLFIQVHGRIEEAYDSLMPTECVNNYIYRIQHTDILIPVEQVVLADVCFYTGGLPCLEIAPGLFEEAFPYVCNADIETYVDVIYPTGEIERRTITHTAGTTFLAKGRAVNDFTGGNARQIYYQLPGIDYRVI